MHYSCNASFPQDYLIGVIELDGVCTLFMVVWSKLLCFTVKCPLPILFQNAFFDVWHNQESSASCSSTTCRGASNLHSRFFVALYNTFTTHYYSHESAVQTVLYNFYEPKSGMDICHQTSGLFSCISCLLGRSRLPAFIVTEKLFS